MSRKPKPGDYALFPNSTVDKDQLFRVMRTQAERMTLNGHVSWLKHIKMELAAIQSVYVSTEPEHPALQQIMNLIDPIIGSIEEVNE